MKTPDEPPEDHQTIHHEEILTIHPLIPFFSLDQSSGPAVDNLRAGDAPPVQFFHHNLTYDGTSTQGFAFPTQLGYLFEGVS